MKGFSCNHCHFIFPRTDALEESVFLKYGGPAIRYSCPECHRAALEEIGVCVECMQKESMSDDDLCRECSLFEQDAADDLVLQDERLPKSELSLLCADIAMMPWRRVG